jgi:hypothetical protein
MAAHECAPAGGTAQGARITREAGFRSNLTTSRPLELILRDGGRVVGLLTVQAERSADGWHFAGRIPGWALP